jgi:antitoxin HicB
VFGPSNLSIRLDKLIKAASAVGRAVEFLLKRDAERTLIIVAQKAVYSI